MNLFVYGTLLAGMSRHTELVGTRRLGPASVQGTLRDLGKYPGLFKGSSLVTGELHEVTVGVLGRLDEVEGFHPDNPSRSLYTRTELGRHQRHRASESRCRGRSPRGLQARVQQDINF